MRHHVIATHRPLWLRALGAAHALYLRQLIRSAEVDAQRHDWHAASEPILADMARRRAAELRVRLASLT